MKKKISVIIGVIAIAGVLGIGVYHSSASPTETSLSSDEVHETVKAQYPGEIISITSDKEFNKVVFDVEIENEGRAYNLKLDGNTGEILTLKEKTNSKKLTIAEKEKNADEQNKSEQSDSEPNDNKNTESKNKEKVQNEKTAISIKEAEEIALSQFPGTITQLELDEDDGRLIYEVEIENGEDEAEVEIDAYTGEILVVSIDRDND